MMMESGEHAKDYRDTPKYGGFHDPAGRLHFRDLPCPMVNVNCAHKTHKTLPLIQIWALRQSFGLVAFPDERPTCVIALGNPPPSLVNRLGLG